MCEAQYLEFGKCLRTLIKQELSSEKYPHFRSPSSHVSSFPNFSDAKFRFDILPRPSVSSGNGNHTFNVGHLELSLFLAVLPKSDSFSKGVIFPKDGAYRLVCGTMAAVETLPEAIMDSISDQWAHLKGALLTGDYPSFVKCTMGTVHSQISEFKEFSKDASFLR
jgi:hypothetical protein